MVDGGEQRRRKDIKEPYRRAGQAGQPSRGGGVYLSVNGYMGVSWGVNERCRCKGSSEKGGCAGNCMRLVFLGARGFVC